MADEVRVMEQMARCDERWWQWESLIVSFPGAEKVINHEQACRSQFSWRSKDSEAWNRDLGCYQGRLAIDGSLWRVVTKYGASGWAVVQRDLDGGMTPQGAGYRRFSVMNEEWCKL